MDDYVDRASHLEQLSEIKHEDLEQGLEGWILQ